MIASADRRPVDPPPVVELRIFEGEKADLTDVTFGYNANFFLFATLELARPMAHGRVQPPPNQPPVLTGMPVSGMAYLDRPTEAGYFIFPDLSVRHEGKYKLSFNLYEETKEAKDADAEPSNEQKPKIPGGSAPDSSFDWRLEVKSAMFTVFSAKKFPGLAESTSLSRTVAEQGCRVRIRRDVRMRRRDGKANGDYDDVAEEEYVRAGRPVANDPYTSRARSLSSEDDVRQPYSEQDRRLPGEYAPAGPQGHLNFGQQYGQPYAAPAPQFAQPPPPAPPSYQSALGPYNQSGSQYPRPAPPPPSYAPQSAYPSTTPREREFEEHRRASVAGYAPSASSHPSHYPTLDSHFSRNPIGYQPYARAPSPPLHSPISLAPLKMPSLEHKYDGQSSPPGPLSSISRIAPAVLSPSFERSQDRSYGQYSAPLPGPPEVTRANGKRGFESAFSSAAARQNEPLYNRKRPINLDAFDDDDDMSNEMRESMKMLYKRADGSSYSRDLPVLE